MNEKLENFTKKNLEYRNDKSDCNELYKMYILDIKDSISHINCTNDVC